MVVNCLQEPSPAEELRHYVYDSRPNVFIPCELIGNSVDEPQVLQNLTNELLLELEVSGNLIN